MKARAGDNARKARPAGSPRGMTLSLIVLSTLGFGIVTYASFMGTKVYKDLKQFDADKERSHELSSERTLQIYDKNASTYDRLVQLDEFLMGLNRLKRMYAKEGEVLEVSAGTGRTFDFYDYNKIKSLTLLDGSSEMLEIARSKWAHLKKIRDSTNQFVPDVKFVTQQLLEHKVQRQFDCIFQSMGLCSHQDPKKHMSTMLDLLKPEGRIVLIEHGRASYSWLNRILDCYARDHLLEYGCAWNRDIEKIVRDSGLQVIHLERRNFGTTYVIVGQKPNNPAGNS